MGDVSQFSLEGRVALVTGASSGIGYALAIGLARAGARVAVAARRKARLDKLVAEITKAGGTAQAVTLDVTAPQQIDSALDAIEAAFEQCADVIVNNAGIGHAKPFLQTPPDELAAVMQTNFTAAYQLAQRGAARMVAQERGGAIINIASMLGTGGKRGYSAYCASKAALINATRAMALDLQKHNIRVNAIAPGWFVTELNQDYLTSEAGKAFLATTPAGAAGKLEDLIGPTILLASDAGAFVNGVVLAVDGAHTASWI